MIGVRRIESKENYDFTDKLFRESNVLSLPEQADPSILLTSQGWTLFELDYKNGCAVFLDIGAEGDLFHSPFAYSAQARQALNYAEVPFEIFIRLARSIKPKRRLVNLFNIGHCGSTLLHNVVDASGEAWGLSEPKFTQDVAFNRNKISGSKQVELLQAGLAFLDCIPCANDRGTLMLKHFSQSTKIYDFWQAAAPEAMNLYMYRDAVTWCNSMFGFAQRMGMPAPMPFASRQYIWMLQSCAEPISFFEGIVDIENPALTFEDLAACAWALHMQEILAARARDMKFFTFRYSELLRDRAGVLNLIFKHCGFNPARIADGLEAFDHDAHEGEQSAHDRPVVKLGADAKKRIVKILQNPSFAFNPDLIL